MPELPGRRLFRHLSLMDTDDITDRRISRGSTQLLSQDINFSPSTHNFIILGFGSMDKQLRYLYIGTLCSDCYSYLNYPLVFGIHWVLTNNSFISVYYIDRHYALSSIFLNLLIYFYSLFKKLYSFKEINSTSDSTLSL